MDRIRKALDLARQERANPPETAPVAPRAADARAAQRLPIVYETTRLFAPDPTVLDASRIVDPAGMNSATAAYRMLRTQVIQRMDANGWRSLAVLSPNSHEGKTTTAINLAACVGSDHHHTALLVDCDLKRPRIAARLGFEPEFGLNDILSGRATVDQCLYHPIGFDRLVVLPSRVERDNCAEELSGPRGRDLVLELKDRYPDRVLLFDLPPILGADDALAFLPLLECGLVVVAEGETRRQDLLRCMELTQNKPIVGTVLNRTAAVQSAYG
jgi:protein-tyrosine kinase